MGADAAAEEQFGPYVVYERLGVGGMATVHRAIERGIEGFERVVALKRLLPHLAADATFIKSFVREAKLASYLKHVNIVQLFELGRVGSAYFISMEYIDGRDIRRILRQARKVSGPPPIHVTVGLLLQLCDALDYAHHKVDDDGHPLGLVHRDVSPSNVLVTTTGQIKVIDFGIAKAQSAQLRTQTGRVKGKLAYMAPEVLAGKELDARSDLFAVGVIAHELLTARPLFATKNEYQTLMKVQRGEVAPPSTFNQGCPPELDAVVLRALARDPDERFRHASDMREQLHAIRKQYKLQTAERDIVTWLDWAFSLEAPGSGFTANHELDAGSGMFDVRSPRQRPPRAKRSEDDEAVEVAWGDGEELSNGQPILLDDVPDVSAKHLSSASALGAEVRLDLDDLADDMPTPPGGGSKHASRSPSVGPVPRPSPRPSPRVRQPSPAHPVRASQAIPIAAPDSDPGQPAGAAGSMRHSQVAAMPGPGDRSQPAASLRHSQAIATVPALADRSQAVPAARLAPDHSQAVPAATFAADRSQAVLMPPRSEHSQAVPVATIAARDRSQAVPAGDRRDAVPALVDSSQSMSAAVRSPQDAATSSAVVGASVRNVMPPRVRSIPATARVGQATATAPRTEPSLGPPPQTTPAATPPRNMPAASTPPHDQALAAAQPRLASASTPPRSRRQTSPGTGTMSMRADVASQRPETTATTRHATATVETEQFLTTEPDPAQSLAGDTIPSMPALSAAEPIVRFHGIAQSPGPALPPTARPGGDPAARSGGGASARSGGGASARSRGGVVRPVTPATDLFALAEPDLDGEPADATIVSKYTGPLPPAPAPTKPPAPSTPPEGALPVATLASAAQEPIPRRRWARHAVIAAAVALVLAAAAIAIVQFLAPDRAAAITVPAPPLPPPQRGPTVATIQLALDPADASITIDGVAPSIGAASNIELSPGPHQIEIHRDGYKTWLTSINLAAGESLPLRVDLEVLGAGEPAHPSSAPQPAVDKRTDRGETGGTAGSAGGAGSNAPRAIEDKSAGSAAGGNAGPGSQRVEHDAATPAPRPRPASAPPATGAAASPAPPPAQRQTPADVSSPSASSAPPRTPVPASQPPSGATASTGPRIVPVSAVSKISGDPPDVKLAGSELPPVMDARLCIDDEGRVTAARVLTSVDARAETEIATALQSWRYAPYQADGTAQAVCFDVTFWAR